MRLLTFIGIFTPVLALVAHEEDGKYYSISRFALEYLTQHSQLPSLETLEDVPIALGKTEIGYVAPKEGEEVVTVTLKALSELPSAALFHRSALQGICMALLQDFQAKDIGGAHIFVKEGQIGKAGEDLRYSGYEHLNLAIEVASIEKMRVLVKNANTEPEESEKKRHHMLLESCPVQEGDLLAPDALENYIFFLNRFPNRQVEMVVGGVGRPQVVGLDILITEEKPWRVYANVANTGPKGLNRWQETVGYVNTQLTGYDDVLHVNVSTDSFNRFHSEFISYERPLPHMPRVRLEAIGSYNQFSSAQLGMMTKEFVGKQALVSVAVDWNAYQKRDFFFDLIGGIQYQYFNVDNRLFHIKGHQGFILPILGMQFSRFRKDFRFFLEMDIEAPINGLTNVKQSNLDKLGRFDASKDWFLFTENGYVAFFLESLFSSHPKVFANEILLSLYSQYAGNQRLIPEFQGTVGGLYSVRGYPTAYASGDNTLTYNAEYILHLPRLFYKTSSESAGCYKENWDLLVRAFFDGARAVNNKSSCHRFRECNATLLGTGVGAELIIKQNFFLRADWGWALSRVFCIKPGHSEFYLSGTIVY